jgi:hypothetical protein
MLTVITEISVLSIRDISVVLYLCDGINKSQHYYFVLQRHDNYGKRQSGKQFHSAERKSV